MRTRIYEYDEGKERIRKVEIQWGSFLDEHDLIHDISVDEQEAILIAEELEEGARVIRKVVKENRTFWQYVGVE